MMQEHFDKENLWCASAFILIKQILLFQL